MIAFRHTDPRFPFLWETADQPGGRWHAEGQGPANALADTPEGAWAELLRHEEITSGEDLQEVRRSLWAVEVGDLPPGRPRLVRPVLTGGPGTYETCRREAARLRGRGEPGLVATSAALLPGQAHGWRVEGGLHPGPRRDGRVIVLFGPRPDLIGWEAVHEGRPSEELLGRVRHLAEA